MWERIIEWCIIILLVATALFFTLVDNVGDEWRRIGN